MELPRAHPPQFVKLLLGLSEPCEDRVGVPHQQLAGVRQSNPTGPSLEQHRPGFLLEQRYLA
jgi:hypothetical protein